MTRKISYIEDWFRGGPDWFNGYAPGGDSASDWLPAFARYCTNQRDTRVSQSNRYQRGTKQAPCYIGAEQDTYEVSDTIHCFGSHFIGLTSKAEIKFSATCMTGLVSHYPRTSIGPGSSHKLDGIWAPWAGHGNGGLIVEDLYVTGRFCEGSIGILVRAGLRLNRVYVGDWGWKGIDINADIQRGNATTGSAAIGDTQVLVGNRVTNVGSRYDIGVNENRLIVAKVGSLVTVDEPFDAPVAVGDMIWPRSYDPRFAGISNSNKITIYSTTCNDCGHYPGTDPLLVTPANPEGRRHPGTGLSTIGGDANIISVYDCSFNYCAGWGLNDSSFLGPNAYYSPHSAYCGHIVTRYEADLMAHPEATASELELWDFADYEVGDNAQLCYRAVGGNLRAMLFQPYIEGAGKVYWEPGEGKVFGGINVDIGASKTITDSTLTGSLGKHTWRTDTDEGGKIEHEFSPETSGDCYELLRPSDESPWPIRKKYTPWPANNPHGSRAGADNDAGFLYDDWGNTTVGMRTTTTYSRAADGRMYTRTVPITDAVIAGNVCTVTVAAHPFSTGDLVWSENLSLNVASASAVPCTVLSATQVAFALVGPDGQLADHVGNLKARSSLTPGIPSLPDVYYVNGRHCMPVAMGTQAALPDLSVLSVQCYYPVGSRYVVRDCVAGGPSEYRCVADGGAPYGKAWKALLLEA